MSSVEWQEPRTVYSNPAEGVTTGDFERIERNILFLKRTNGKVSFTYNDMLANDNKPITWTVPEQVTRIHVSACGGGGSGGAGTNSGDGTYVGAGGGGGGAGCKIKFPVNVQPGQEITLTIGRGGIGIHGYGGEDGQDTTIAIAGITIRCRGGKTGGTAHSDHVGEGGGSSGGVGGENGQGTVADFLWHGIQVGGRTGGNGGDCLFGIGGSGSGPDTDGGIAYGYGAGGGGAGDNAKGGDGAPGFVLIEW